MEIAPLSRRFGALAIDMLVGLLAVAGVLGAIVLVMRPWKREPPDLGWMRRLQTRSLMKGVFVGFRNVRSPGQRLMGIRRADIRSGGPVSARSAIVKDASLSMMSALFEQPFVPRVRRDLARWQAVQPRVAAIHQQHRDDPEQRERVTMEFYKEHGGANPFGSCVLALLAGLALQLPALWSPRHQTMPERLAGIVVVRDRRG
jgi:RDD family